MHLIDFSVRGKRTDNVYLLEERLGSEDTYRMATLHLRDGRDFRVRVFTMDDVTVIRPIEDGLPDHWEGTLSFPARSRERKMPSDLVRAFEAAGIEAGNLDPVVRRHLIGFVLEARQGPAREARVAAAVLAARS